MTNSKRRRLAQAIILTLLTLVLLSPVILISPNLYFQKGADILFLVHRLFGLYAFSLIFVALVMGSEILFLDRIFTPGTAFRTHQLIGKVAFTLALLHPVFLYSTYFLENNLSYILPFQTGTNFFFYFLGVMALALLILTVSFALLRFTIGPRWLSIHRLNYFIFWLIFFHSLNLGVDLQTKDAQLLYITYGIVVGILTVRRITRYS